MQLGKVGKQLMNIMEHLAAVKGLVLYFSLSLVESKNRAKSKVSIEWLETWGLNLSLSISFIFTIHIRNLCANIISIVYYCIMWIQIWAFNAGIVKYFLWLCWSACLLDSPIIRKNKWDKQTENFMLFQRCAVLQLQKCAKINHNILLQHSYYIAKC